MKRLVSLAVILTASAALAANVTWTQLGGIEETANVVTDVTVPSVVADTKGDSDLTVTVTPVTQDGTTTQYKIKVAAPTEFDPSALQGEIDALFAATNTLQSSKADKATTLAGYGITDAKIVNGTITLGNQTLTPLTSFTETDPTVPSWAKESTKPSYQFSELTTTPTTLAGYGITDAKIENGTITLGNQTLTPLTSFTETDPTIKAWAKADTKPSYTAAEVGAIANTAVSGIAWDNGIEGDISTLHETILALQQLITALGGTPPGN